MTLYIRFDGWVMPKTPLHHQKQFANRDKSVCLVARCETWVKTHQWKFKKRWEQYRIQPNWDLMFTCKKTLITFFKMLHLNQPMYIFILNIWYDPQDNIVSFLDQQGEVQSSAFFTLATLSNTSIGRMSPITITFLLSKSTSKEVTPS